jgi:2-C-methyl-D-erythritol 4-phosphate cytidylyltransferase
MLRDSITTARLHDGAVVAVPVKDTIKIVQNGIIHGTPLRENLWQAQTPQSFRFGKIFNSHLSAEVAAFSGTDDASLIERDGGEVHIIRGDYRNIKITTPEDLLLAEAFISGMEKECKQC